MISGHITGSANLRQKPAAMGVKRTVPAAAIDDKIISVADMIPNFNDCAGLHRQNRSAVGKGNVQTIVVGGVLAGDTDISRLFWSMKWHLN